MPDMLLPEKVKIFPAIPEKYQRYVYPFATPHFRSTSSFSRIEQITVIPGCRVSSIVNIAEKKTVIRYHRKNTPVTLQVIIKGKMTCSPSSLSLSNGEYNLNAGPHQLLLQPGVNEFMRFEISPALLPVFIRQGDYYSSGTVTRKVESLINTIRNAAITDDIQQLRLHTHITELITAAITNLQLPYKDMITNNPHQELMTRIQSYINENLHKSISLSMLAGIYYISESKLKQDFKKYLNSSVQAYLQEQRMQKALRMLQHSDNEIVAIANEVGYNNVSSFTREFRKHYACSPKEIRLR
jgi:AraC-like DNA-binding protein